VSEILLYFLFAPPLLLLALPLLLSLRISRTESTSPITVEIRLGIYRALAGFTLHIAGPQRLLHILLFNQKLPIPRFDLSAKPKPTPKASPSSALPTQQTVQTDAPSPTDTKQDRNILLLLQSLASPLLDFFIRFPRIFSLGELRIQGRGGFANPAHTGSLYGLQQALQTLPFKRFYFHITPDFFARSIYGQARLTLHIHLGFIIALCIRLAVRAGLRYLAMRFRFRIARFI
jgi:hypothetical protein